jgi:hypothetical protein
MAFAELVTKLPLDRWAVHMGINSLHWNGVQIPAIEKTLCDSAWCTWEWQSSDRVSREEVARAIAQAESDIERYVGYRLLPSWEVDEWRATDRPYRREMSFAGSTGFRGYGRSVEAKWKWFITGGIRKQDLVDAAAAIIYSDADSDSYDETAIVTVTVVAGTLPCELAVYYPGKAGAERWRIRPIAVSITGTTATIAFRREQCVLEALWDELTTSWSAVDGMVDANFLDEVDVYRITNDPSTQATLVWEPGGSCSCNGTGCTACTFNVQTACLHLRGEPRLAFLAYNAAEWDAVDEEFDSRALSVGRNPDAVRLFYRAGYESPLVDCPYTEMDSELERVIAIYAASMLDRPPCGCAEQQWERWAKDLGFVGGASELASYNLSAQDLNNPFGTRAGAVFAWKWASREGVTARHGGVLV